MGGKSLFQVGDDVEYWRVLVFLSILAFSLVIFDAALHRLEHKLAHYDKYQHMLRKVYRELMILGLLSLGLKIAKEVGLYPYSKTMLAFQVADLTVFILALALVLQAIVVFLMLRSYNEVADRTELITAQDLIDGISPPPGEEPVVEAKPSFIKRWFSWSKKPTTGFEPEIVKRRLLRQLFLRRFGLPQLFPFSKYLRRAQGNQISHMIEVEPTMWILLLAVGWIICGFLNALLVMDFDLPKGHELVDVFVVFAWGLLVLHVVVLLYFRCCINQLIHIAGYSEDKTTLLANLREVAEEESDAWRNEAADIALNTMNRVHEELEELEDIRKAKQNALIQKDAGLELLVSCCSSIKHHADDEMTKNLAKSQVLDGGADVKIRLFSCKAWHFVVIFMLVLNGFFIALLLQCAVYDLDEIHEDFGLFSAIAVPFPLVVNTFVLQHRMLRYFVMVHSILRVDANTMGEVVNHFSEIVELRSDFASSLLSCLKENDYTIIDLRCELIASDPRQTGMVDVDKLRLILASFGFRLTRFRFNSVAMMLFDLNGTRVEYGQLIRLLVLAQNDAMNDNNGDNQRRQHPLLRRSSDASRISRSNSNSRVNRSSSRFNLSSSQVSRQVPLLPQPSVEPELSQSDFVHMRTPSSRNLSATDLQRRADGSNLRSPALDRSYVSTQSNQFSASSSRALHDMFNIRRGSDVNKELESPDTAYTIL